MKNIFDTIDAYLMKMLVFLICVMFIALVVLVALQIYIRYLTVFSLTWSEELTTYLMIWMALFASVVAFRNNSHISVDAFVRILSAKMRPLALAIGNALIIGFYLIILWGSFKLLPALNAQLSQSLGVPLSYLYLVMPFSMVLSCFYIIKHCYDEICTFLKAE